MQPSQIYSQSARKPSRHRHSHKHKRQKSVYEKISCMTKSKLGELLLTVADYEIDIEKLRQQLANINDFEPYSAFTRIDRDSKGQINGRDICQFIKANDGKVFLESQCNYLIKYFDSEDAGHLNYTDFMQILLPCDDPYLRAAATQRPSKKILSYQFLPLNIEKALIYLLQREVEFHIDLEHLKRELESCSDYNCRQAFKAIDETNKGYIDSSNLKVFLRKMGHQVLQKEIVAIIRRFDLDGDSKITYQDFSEGLSPVSPEIIPISSREKIYGSPLRSMKRDSDYLPSQFDDTEQQRRMRSSDKKSGYKESERQTVESFNKSVTFNKQINVREYNKDQRMKTPQKMTTPRQESTPQYTGSLDLSHTSPLRPTSIAKDRYEDSSYSKKDFYNRQRLEYSPSKEQQEIKQDLIRLCVDQIYLEREIDRFKCEFANISDFSCLEAFKQFDYQSKGFLNLYDFQESINRLVGDVNQNDVYLIFRRYDKDADGKLSFSEFCQLFIPKDQYLCEKISNQKTYYMSQKTMEQIQRIVKAHLNIEKAHEYFRSKFKKQLQLSKSFHQEVFRMIDKDNKGYLTAIDLKDILFSQSKGEDLNYDIELLMQLYNKKGEKRITYLDFIDEVTPRQQ